MTNRETTTYSPNSTVVSRTSALRILAWPAFENKTGNPYTRLLYEAMEAETDAVVEDVSLARALSGGYDIWHVHWPDDFLSYRSPLQAWAYVLAELVLFAVARARGARLVWTVHDLGPHESYHPWLEALFWRLFLPQVDGFVALSEAAREEAQQTFPELRSVPHAVVPHGHYRPAYPEPMPRAAARSDLGLPEAARVAAFVGRIRPYKNVPHLIDTFAQWDAPDARLVVAGNPSADTLATQIAAKAGADSRVTTDLRFIADREMVAVLSAADFVVLPYDDIMHSGTALLALSFDRPVLVPDRGAMSELKEQVGADWVRTYAGALTPEILSEAMSWAETTDRPSRAPLDDLDWPRLGRQTAALYHRVVADRS